MKMLRIVGITAVVAAGLTVSALALGALGIYVFKIPWSQQAYIGLTEAGNKLDILEESGNLGACPSPRQPGCIGVSKYRKAKIQFRLVNMDDWTFKQIQLVAEPLPKLNFGEQDPPLTDVMKDDFYVKINSTKIHPNDEGIIDLAGLQPGYKFKLVDLNKFPQIYSYQIEACNGDGSVCKEMDPKIRNEGTQ